MTPQSYVGLIVTMGKQRRRFSSDGVEHITLTRCPLYLCAHETTQGNKHLDEKSCNY